ncbi:MAG: ATP-binding protein [Gammaproteobacteria bacterium]
MNVFVAGIHCVGKTYLASRAAPKAGMVHKSASNLIKEERALVTWTDDKRVADVSANQQALAAAVRRYNESGTRLLLDGHFVLQAPSGELIRLERNVFAAIGLNGVLLIEADPQTVAQRIEARDEQQASIDHLKALMGAERDQAQKVCAELRIPLTVLVSPSPEAFEAAVASFRHDRE